MVDFLIGIILGVVFITGVVVGWIARGDDNRRGKPDGRS